MERRELCLELVTLRDQIRNEEIRKKTSVTDTTQRIAGLAEKFVENLLSGDAHRLPSDSVKVEDLEMKLPEWFDEKKYNQGRRFYRDFFFMMSASMILGVLALFSIPSILNVLVGSRRSSSSYTAYKRYFSTHQHVNAWFEHELKPDSIAWRSLYTVRSRHIQAGRAARLKGTGTISQRDVALTLFGFIGFAFLKPDQFRFRQLKEGDWDAYNHCWKVIGHMIGLEDRFNICRDTYVETRQVCKILQHRVFTPCLENVPEYFEHMSRVMLEGVSIVLTDLETSSMMYAMMCLAEVPGYINSERDRIDFQTKLRKHQVNGQHRDEVDEYIRGLFSKEAFEQPCDEKLPEGMRIPAWFDEKQYNRARRFYWEQCFQFTLSMILGLVAVLAVPSILQILISSRRSNSIFTAYRRYVSTLLHTVSWFEHDLKPGSVSWRSLLLVRTRHIKASRAANLQDKGVLSQRDLALTQFGFIGFSVLKPNKFGIRQLEEGDWEAYNHFWRVIGHTIGLEDRYNLCRKNFEETRQVCQILLDRVFTPCLENVPEYFEHMARSMLNGTWYANPAINVEVMIYWTKYLAGVPGYIDTDVDRMNLQDRIRKQLRGRSEETGVDVSDFIAEPLISLPATSRRLIYLHDYDIIEKAPSYKRLTLAGRYKLSLNVLLVAVHSSYFGRIYLNLVFKSTLFFVRYFPYMAFFKFGVLASYTRLFVEDPIDNEEPKPNSEYNKPQLPLPLYKELLAMIW
ncbi:uncharacterized protein [Maniola hyperantus]|uniref:uncharacterized protein isoform X2 n=1 Tax=Aphantopus hyperantus TaxID=2795564 RepID=UPI00374A2DA6